VYYKSQNATFRWSRHWSVASSAWVHRPAARRTYWTFDVKIAGYVTVRLLSTLADTINTLLFDSDHAECFLLLISYNVLLQTSFVINNLSNNYCCFQDTDISQRSLETHLKCGEIYSDRPNGANFLTHPTTSEQYNTIQYNGKFALKNWQNKLPV